MKYVEIAGFSKAEMVKKLKANRADITQLIMKNSLGQLSNPVQIRHKRRDIARFMTALTKLNSKGDNK